MLQSIVHLTAAFDSSDCLWSAAELHLALVTCAMASAADPPEFAKHCFCCYEEYRQHYMQVENITCACGPRLEKKDEPLKVCYGANKIFQHCLSFDIKEAAIIAPKRIPRTLLLVKTVKRVDVESEPARRRVSAGKKRMSRRAS